MEGAGGEPRGVMGSGARGGTHLYCLDSIRPGNCWERHPLLEGRAARRPAQRGGLAWHDAHPPLLTLPTKSCLARRHLHHRQPVWLLHPQTPELIFLSLQAGSLPRALCTHKQSHFAASITPPSLSLTLTHTHVNSTRWFCHITWQNTSRFFGFFFFSSVPSSRWCEWLSRLDLISAAPIWIWKGDRHTHNQKVCHIPTWSALNIALGGMHTQVHTWMHTPEGRMRREGGGVGLCNQVISLPWI